MKIYDLIQRSTVVLIFLGLVVSLLLLLKSFFIPLFLGILFSLMLLPLARQLESWRLPRILSNLILILSGLILITGTVVILSFVLRSFLQDLPAIEQNFTANLTNTTEYIETTFGVSIESQLAWIKDNMTLSKIFGDNAVGALVGLTTKSLFTLGLTVVYTFFFLYYRDKFTDFLKKLVPKRRHGSLLRTLDEIDNVAPHYMLGVATVVIILAIINTIGFTIIGIQSPIFFGVVAALLNIIPFVGTIFGFAVVFLFALATQHISIALGVLVMFFIVQFTDNNILTPNITASRVDLNPLVAIISIILGNLLWGVVGMFLAIPFLAMSKIIFDSVSELKPIGFLLGTTGTEKYALSLSSIKSRFTKKK